MHPPMPIACPGLSRPGRQVRGMVAKLVRVKDPAASLALEVAAGGKLYQVRRLPGLVCGV
jgi:hypothetical protein